MAHFEIGQPIRILDGPFINFVGVVRDTRTTGDRIRVLVGVADREVEVDIDRHRLEALR
jgi:transcription termination/antitermination protein NusG